MKIKTFRIRNYRAIEDLEIKLNYSINPIIGLNESGKTTILKAILAFDKNRDNFKGGEHLTYKNKYISLSNKDAFITATLILEKYEIEELIKYAKVSTDSDDYKLLKKFNTKTVFYLRRVLNDSTNHYEYIEDNLTDKTKELIQKYLFKNLPFILYFDDFNDRVPDSIPFPADYKDTGRLRKSKIREWQDIIVEIFKRTELEGLEDEESPIQAYLNQDNPDTKDDILGEIQDFLNKEVINEWIRIKKAGDSLGDDSDKLQLTISNEGNAFKFKVKDSSRKDKKRTFDINERSKGFQWFFNYMIKLKFNPNYNKDLEDSIFLLDEPGSYLHSAAQRELLNELRRVSEKNTIVYCTHSQYLLNPETIKLGSIKISEKTESKIDLKDYGNYSTKKDKSALTPIYQALNLNFASDFIGKIAITEGIIDYYFFKILQSKTNLIPKKIKFIPGCGASQSKTLISLGLGFADNYIVLLDNDTSGRRAKKEYLKTFGDEIEKNIYMYHKKNELNFVLENFLSDNDTKRLHEITECKDTKRALGFLFYDYTNQQKEFLKSLDKETRENISDIILTLNKL